MCRKASAFHRLHQTPHTHEQHMNSPLTAEKFRFCTWEMSNNMMALALMDAFYNGEGQSQTWQKNITHMLVRSFSKLLRTPPPGGVSPHSIVTFSSTILNSILLSVHEMPFGSEMLTIVHFMQHFQNICRVARVKVTELQWVSAVTSKTARQKKHLLCASQMQHKQQTQIHNSVERIKLT